VQAVCASRDSSLRQHGLLVLSRVSTALCCAVRDTVIDFLSVRASVGHVDFVSKRLKPSPNSEMWTIGCLCQSSC